MPRTALEGSMPKQQSALYLALELAKDHWRLAFSDGSTTVRVVSVPGGSVPHVVRETAKAKRKLGVSPGARVLSCYEAGRDGFWIHRSLTQIGFQNLVVDPSSIEVDRRRRRAKTDRLDADK